MDKWERWEGWGYGGEQIGDWELKKRAVCLFIQKVKAYVYTLVWLLFI